MKPLKRNQMNSFYNTTEQRCSSYSEDLCDSSKMKSNFKNETSEKQNSTNSGMLTISTIGESDSFSFGTAPKMWSMVKINALDRKKISSKEIPMDFVVVIDHSSSMKTNKKLAFVQATIEYLIYNLNCIHRFCLIKFNQEVNLVTNGLIEMTSENKKKILILLHEIKPQGQTNISDALFTSVGILSNRHPDEQNRVSTIMIFTDGLSNTGLTGKAFSDSLKDMIIPSGLTINTFGYGLDHDSKMLQNISFSSKGGVYYYIENVKTIPATFGECLAGLLSTVAHNIEIRLVAQDGCRIVNFYTKFPIKELKTVKDYVISLGSMYSQESRSILFKLSMRKMEKEIPLHVLAKVIISYTNTLDGSIREDQTLIVVGRPKVAPEFKIPIELDKQINRYTAAVAIEEAVKKATSKDFYAAQKQLQEVIDIVQTSASAKDPISGLYCADLIQDLKECSVGMEDIYTFSCGIHYAYSYSTMYFMERSTGSANLMGVKKSFESHQEIFEESEKRKNKRNSGYGYVTYEQEKESLKAVKQAESFVSGYLDNLL